MPIKPTNKEKTFKFEYVNERDQSYVLEFEYHHTPDFGPTLTIKNLANGEFSLPFSAFSDAVDEVRNETGLSSSANVPITRPVAASGKPSVLMPTRVSGATTAAKPTIARPVSRPNADPSVEGNEEGGPVESEAIYMRQGEFLTSDGAVESFATPSAKPKPKPKPTINSQAQARTAIVPVNAAPPEDDFPPEMSLANGAAKRKLAAEVNQARRIKQIPPKPGEPGYNEWMMKHGGQE